MSLLTNYHQLCTPLTRVAEPDGAGGELVRWTEGEAFHAAMVPLDGAASTEAGRDVPPRRWRVLTRRDQVLPFHGVFRAGGRRFRVISGAGPATPEQAALDLRLHEAEELPDV